MNRRITGALALGLASALVLAGCGDDGGSGDGEGKVEVFTWWTEGGEKAGLDALVAQFDKDCPDFTFENGAVAGGAGSNAKSVLASRLQSGDPPDTFQAHAGGELSDYIAAGQLEDLTAQYDEWGLNDAFPQTLLDNLTVDGKIYSVPANVHRANVVWANPKVLQKAGLDTEGPADLDAWLADLAKLKSSGVSAPLAIAKDWTQVMLLETVLLAELGPEQFTALWQEGADWSSQQVTGALNTYKQLLGYTNTDRDSLDWPDATKYVTQGQAAYTVMGDWVPSSLEQENLELGADWVWFPVPGTDGAYQFLSDSFVLPKGAPNADGTRCWLETVGSEAGQVAFNKEKGSIPARTDVDTGEFSEYQQAAIEDWKSDTVVPSLAHGSAAPIAWSNDVLSAVGAFSADQNVKSLQDKLVQAAENAQ